MAVREILQLGNPTLWEESARVDRVDSADTQQLITDLSDTLAEFREVNGFGRGIAAPQIGALRRIIYVRMPDNSFDGPLINPEIVRQSDDHTRLWDSCFSFPDLLVRVSRAVAIRVEYLDRSGQARMLDARGDLAELLQHEIDHLDGALAIHRAVGPRAFATRTQWERMGRPR